MDTAPATFLALVGPTCIGKTKFAHELMEEFPLELVNLDSFQVYSFFRIGTGRDDLHTERAHLYGFRSPQDILLPEQYLSLVEGTLKAIASNNRFPLFEGGSISYINALLQRYNLNLIGLRPRDEAHASELIGQRITSASEEMLIAEIVEGLQSGYQSTLILRDDVVYLPYVEYVAGTTSLAEARKRVQGNLFRRYQLQMQEYRSLPVDWFTYSDDSRAEIRSNISRFLDTQPG